MPKLEFVVNTTDTVDGVEYLLAVQKAFQAVIDLNKWGYTQDELFCTSQIEVNNDTHSTKVYDHAQQGT